MSWWTEDLWKKNGVQTAKLLLDMGPRSVPQSSNPAILAISWLNLKARPGGAPAHSLLQAGPKDSGPFSKGCCFMTGDLLIYGINAFMPHFYIFLAPSLPFTLFFSFLFCVFNPLAPPEGYKEDSHIQHLLLEDTSAYCTYVPELHDMTQLGMRHMTKQINSRQWGSGGEFHSNISLPRTAFLALASGCFCPVGSRRAMPIAWLKISSHRQREWIYIGVRAPVWSWMGLRISSMGNPACPVTSVSSRISHYLKHPTDFCLFSLWYLFWP